MLQSHLLFHIKAVVKLKLAATTQNINGEGWHQDWDNWLPVSNNSGIWETYMSQEDGVGDYKYGYSSC